MVSSKVWINECHPALGVDVGTSFRGESAIISPNKTTVVPAGIEGDVVLMWDTTLSEES
jgi:hypothetical protein